MNPNQYPQPGSQPPGYPQQPGPYPPTPGQPMPGGSPGQYPQQPPYGQPQQPYMNGPGMPQSQPGMPPMGGPQQPSQYQSPMMGYNPYPYPDEFGRPKSRGPNKLVLGGMAVLVIITVIVAVLATSSSGGNGQNNQNQNQSQNQNQQSSDSNKDVVPRSDGKLDLSSKIKASQTLKQQTVQGNMNEQVNLSSGFSFMITKVEKYTSTNEETKPADGKRFIVATIVIGDRAESSNLSVSYLDFRLRDSDNTLIAGSSVTNEILNNPLSSPTELKPGEQMTGKIIFEVAQNDTSWVFKHSETYQKTTDNTTFNVEGEIVIKLAASTSNSSSSSSSNGTSDSTDTTNGDNSSDTTGNNQQTTQ